MIDLIDTPGHVDFGYEVSRSLAACEGVILLVDAAQGIEAQTLANSYQALEHDLEIVAASTRSTCRPPTPTATRPRSRRCWASRPTRSCVSAPRPARACPNCSMPSSSDAAARRRPRRAAPGADLRLPLRPLPGRRFLGRVVNGNLTTGSRLRFMQAGSVHDADEVGVRTPANTPVASLGPGETGYLIAGIKDVAEARSGETVTETARPAARPLAGYRDPKPMVFCGLYPVDGDQFSDLRESLEKLRLNDASFTYEPETSGALGFGFRCGFLGLLHMEIVRERLEREFDLSLIATAPSVAYQVHRTDGTVVEVDNPSAMPEAQEIDHIEEPFLSCTILTPTAYTGTLMELCQQRRRDVQARVPLARAHRADLPACRSPRWCVTSSTSSSRAPRATPAWTTSPPAMTAPTWSAPTCCSTGWPPTRFSAIVHKDKAYDYGRRMAERLRELIPRQLFDVPIQAAIGGRIISRETVKAKRKDVLAKC